MPRLPPALSASTLMLFLGACAAAPVATGTAPPVASPLVFHASDVPRPAAGAIAQRDPLVTRRLATRVMRLAPGARIPLHHHAGYDETFTVMEGALVLTLDSVSYDLRFGDVVVIPAGTTITGANGAAESTVVVVWSNTGSGEALTTPGAAPGRPH